MRELPLLAEEALSIALLRGPGKERYEEIARRDPILDFVIPAPSELQFIAHPGLDPGAAQIRRKPPHAVDILTGVAQEQPKRPHDRLLKGLTDSSKSHIEPEVRYV